MKILLTGATGFLGNNILRLLNQHDHEVVILTRHSSDPRATDGTTVEKIYADLSRPDDLGLALEGVDLLIHSAAMIQIGWTRLEQSMQINVEGTRALAKAARLKGIRMVHVSTVDTLAAAESIESPADESCLQPPKPRCSYVVSKTLAEKAVLEEVESGLDGVIVNPGFMVGPWDWKPSSGEMMLAVAKRFTPLAPAGGCTAVDVRDVADGVYLAARKGKPGERYILGGENISYFDLWKKMATVSGSRPPRGVLPDAIASMAGKFGDLMGKLPAGEGQINSAATKMGQMFHYYSSRKAIDDLGYKINSLDDALVDAWDWFKKFGYAK